MGIGPRPDACTGRPRANSKVIVPVVAGVLRDSRDRVLIAQRPPGKHLAGGWEFPGGKRHAGESAEAALVREFREELGVEIGDLEFLMTIDHEYPDRHVTMETFLVGRCLGEPQGHEGQALRWCPIALLASAGILPADLPIIDALCQGKRGQIYFRVPKE